MTGFVIERTFPFWKLWKWRGYLRTKKYVSAFLEEIGETLEKIVFKAVNDMVVFGSATINLKEFE